MSTYFTASLVFNYWIMDFFFFFKKVFARQTIIIYYYKIQQISVHTGKLWLDPFGFRLKKWWALNPASIRNDGANGCVFVIYIFDCWWKKATKTTHVRCAKMIKRESFNASVAWMKQEYWKKPFKHTNKCRRKKQHIA